MSIKRTAEQGFTLIELLVVIAIIGLLSSVIIASLNSARSKGSDASIKSNLETIRTQAELVYDNNSQSYAAICSDATIAAALTSAANNTGSTVVTTLATAGTATTVVCHPTASAYAVEAPLKATSGHYWCIDSTGASKDTTTVLAASGTVCI
jgi:type IV pilus assembly protein PilA